LKTVQYNTIFLVTANSLQVILSLILSIALARYFEGKDIFGKYQQLFVVINFLTLITSGIPLGMLYFYGKYLDFSSRLKIYKPFGITLFLLAFFLGASVCLSSSFLSQLFRNNYFEDYFIFLGIILMFKIVNSYFLNFSLTRGKLGYYFSVICFEFIISILFILSIYTFQLSIYYILLGLVLIALFKFILYVSNSIFYFKIKSNYILTKVEFSYILPITAATMTSALTIYTDKFMISTFLNPESFAEYQIGAFSIPFIGIITGSVVTALVPVISRLKSENKTNEIINQMSMATRKTTLFLLPILVYCIILGDKLIVLLYGDLYYNSGVIFQLYTCIYLLSMIVFSAVMNAIGLQKWVLRNSILNLILNVTFNFILIPIYGVFGAVFATLITCYLGYFLPVYLIKKHLKANFLDYFPIWFYLKILTISLIVAFIILTLFNLFQLNNWFVFIVAFPFYVIVIILGGGKDNFKNFPLFKKYLKNE